MSPSPPHDPSHDPSPDPSGDRSHDPTAPAETADVAGFLVRLGRALHTYGTPSHRNELALRRISERLGVRGQFLVTPTSILAAVGDDDEGQTLRLARVDAGETDLQKLTRIHQVIRDVFDGSLPLRRARAVIDEIEQAPPAYGRFAAWIAFTATSAAAARFFDGGVQEMLAAAVAGAAVGLLNLIGGASERVSRLLPALSGLLAALVAAAGSSMAGAFAPITVLASLIVLLPGLTLTVAMNELALGHVVSGSARLTSATVTFLQLGFGVALGGEVARRLIGSPEAVAQPIHLPEWTLWPALVVGALSLTVLFREIGRAHV